MIGRTLSHYQVIEKIGEGGMGEVYFAKDTKLDREVALKVLPATFSENKERLARFEREARLLASLNHPNIAAIHELEEFDGVHFLALEYVPGETLAERIKRGPIPIDEALLLFKQIAEGLEAAHEKGVIHRDLKPANIKITPEGKVKVLDFGLAKAMAGETPSQGMSESPTITRDATETGVLLGTAPYMSPEQARGKSVDKRTDIWAFGCCLYETLAGKPAFLGPTVTDTLACIVKAEPDWERLPRETPFLLRRLLDRCLDKDPSRRLHDIADARIDIEDALKEGAMPIGGAAVLATEKSHRWRTYLRSAELLALGALLATIIYWATRPPTQFKTASVSHVEIETLPLNLFSTGVAFSPDGAMVVYNTDDQGLYLRALDQDSATPIVGAEGALFPIFSPDGEWIAFKGPGKLKKVPVRGGGVATLSDWTPGFTFGADWEEDDTIVFCDGDGVYKVSANGGPRERLEVSACESEDLLLWARWPDVLPGGETILLTAGPFAGNPAIALHHAESGHRRLLIENGSFARYVPTGHIVFIRDDTLHAVRFDIERLEVQSTPVRILESIHISVTNESAQLALSETGSLVYVPSDWNAYRRKLVWVDRNGHAEQLHSIQRRIAGPKASPNGQHIAMTIFDGTHRSLWLTEVARETLTPLYGRLSSISPAWSPDGSKIAFVARDSDGNHQLHWRNAAASEEAEQLTKNTGLEPAWSPDGETIAFVRFDPETRFDIWTLSLEGDRIPKPFLRTATAEGNPAFSPDGRWLAYASNESGRLEVYVQSSDGSTGSWPVSTSGGCQPVWSPDGRKIYYRWRDKMMAVEIAAEPSFNASTPKVLFEGDYLWHDIHRFFRSYDISRNGKRFLMIQTEGEPVATKVKIVLNWHEELKRLVPTN